MTYELESRQGIIEVPSNTIVEYDNMQIIGKDTPHWNEPIQQNFILLSDRLHNLENGHSNSDQFLQLRSDLDRLQQTVESLINSQQQSNQSQENQQSSQITNRDTGVEPDWTQQTEVDNTLQQTGEIEVNDEDDLWYFHHNGGSLIIDMLTESGRRGNYTEIDENGQQTIMDVWIELYNSNNELIMRNDDSNVRNSIDGSVNRHDSHIRIDNLLEGDYTLLVRSYGHRSHGPYRMTFTSVEQDEIPIEYLTRERAIINNLINNEPPTFFLRRDGQFTDLVIDDNKSYPLNGNRFEYQIIPEANGTYTIGSREFNAFWNGTIDNYNKWKINISGVRNIVFNDDTVSLSEL